MVAVAAAALLVGSGFVWAAEPSFGATCTVLGNFEIDGNMNQGSANCSPPTQDWDTPGLGVQSTNTIGTYSSSSKETNDPNLVTPPGPWTSSGSTPDKSDFNTVYAFTRVVMVSGQPHFDAYVAWERDSGTGTGSYAIEIDNAPVNVVGSTPRPVRSSGGSVIYLDFNGATLPTFLKACTFTSVADFPGTCTTTPGTAYAAQLNDTTITDPFTHVQWPAGQFFEAAIDFTDLTGVAPSCPAPDAASLYLRSITGNTLENLKGYVAPFEVAPPSTCVEPPLDTTASGFQQANARGSDQTDTATLSAVGNDPVPTGTVTFFLCQPPPGATGCSSGGDQVGTAVPVVNGSATSPTVNDTSTPNDLTDGTYCWRAEYAPDVAAQNYYLPTVHFNASSECFEIIHADPQIATTIDVTGDEPGTLGLTTYGDTATLTGFIGDVSGETVNFTLYGPYAANQTPDCTSPDDVAATASATLNASGVATVALADAFTPTVAGTYVWRASYVGDSFNSTAIDDCNQASEKASVVGADVTVTKSANPVGPVSAGDTIGFDISFQVSPAASATDVVITDDLPGTGDLDWSLTGTVPAGCDITGAVGHQTLTCDLGLVAKGTTVGPIHVQSSTTKVDCGVVSNTAGFTSGNAGTGSDSDSVTINCADLHLSKTADAAIVNAGDPLGFVIEATNNGPGIARNVAISDTLPGGAGVVWSLDPAAPDNCSVSTDTPQVLTCTAVDIGAGLSESVHVVGTTAFASCGVYVNTASATSTNTDPPADATATVVVQCPDLALSKTADAATVPLGDPIGFTVHVTNGGPGTSTNSVIDDPLPSGPGISWSISPAYSGPGTCAITTVGGAQVLHCDLGDVAADADVTVHVSSDTNSTSCGTYDNTATLTSDNAPTLSDTASTHLDCPQALPEQVPPLAATGAGPISSELGWAAVMLLAGAAMLLGGIRRRRPTHQ